MGNSKSVYDVKSDFSIENTDNDILLKIEEFFDDETMSVHLKENNYAYAKKGRPGELRFEKVSKAILSKQNMQEISEEIMSHVDKRDDSIIDTEREYSKILQLGKIRIVITTPPLSDAYEITAVKPIKKLSLKDYMLSEKLENRITNRAEGILISGAPGEGKSTFVQALAENYNTKDRVIKTIEAPRDLNLPGNITRYSLNHTKPKEIYDILLLSRPDNTIFDEMRTTDDFKLFSDLRLSGVGMVGVVHATNPVDAIQRFIGRIELGIIPHVIDTVIFIKGGKVNKVFEIEMSIKIPEGMKEADLARPIVSVKDFETGKTEFEIYSYGSDTVVIPINNKAVEVKDLWMEKVTSRYVEDYFKTRYDNVKVKSVDEKKIKLLALKKDVSRIIGKDRQNIMKDEETLGVRIEIESIDVKEEKKEEVQKEKKAIPFEVEFSEKCIHLKIGNDFVEKSLDLFIGKDYLLTAKVGKKGEVKIRMDTEMGKLVTNGIKKGKIMISESS